MKIFERIRERRLVTQAIRQVTAKQMHEILGALSRVQPLAEEFPQLSPEAGCNDRIAKLAENITRDDHYWALLPDLVPLPDDTIEAIVEMSASGQPAKQDTIRKLFAAGVDKGTARISLERLLESYRAGRKVKHSTKDLFRH